MDVIKELGDYLRDIAPKATIRDGDYPREKGMLNVTVILSELSDLKKVRDYYNKTSSFISAIKERQEGIEGKLRGMDKASKDIPSLL